MQPAALEQSARSLSSALQIREVSIQLISGDSFAAAGFFERKLSEPEVRLGEVGSSIWSLPPIAGGFVLTDHSVLVHIDGERATRRSIPGRHEIAPLKSCSLATPSTAT
jgi:hypothetical protein